MLPVGNTKSIASSRRTSSLEPTRGIWLERLTALQLKLTVAVVDLVRFNSIAMWLEITCWGVTGSLSQ